MINEGRYDNGGHHEKLIINRMLGFRPIVPKPVASGPASGSSGGGMHASKRSSVARGKRKYVRVKKTTTSECKRNKKIVVEDQGSKNETTAVTLQLLPDRSVADDVQNIEQVTSMITAKKIVQDNQSTPRKLSLDDVKIVESWVIVESMTHTCMDLQGIGDTDQEKLRNLEVDTCPGFVSDGCNRVQWVNDAYKSMVMMNDNNDDNKPLELRVGLMMKENMEFLSRVAAFTCQVKLQENWRNGKCSQMVPCDVWRMSFGGFAWRLDVKTALKLGR